MTFTEECFCEAGNIKVRVRGGQPVAAWRNGGKMDLTLSQSGPLTVDDLFLVVLRAQAIGTDQLDVT